MSPPRDDVASRRSLLSEVLKAVRQRRGLRPHEAAAAMDMPLRSYEHFEAGCGRLNLLRVHLFAEVLDADPFAIFAALDIGSPDFAVRCADNKFMTILMMALQEFDASARDDIARLTASTLIAAFTRCFDELVVQARAEEEFVGRWMADKVLQRPDEA